jgi:glyoxylase-like metal-dependent hydrolase (beta-lactamase superfamily II)
MFGLIPKAMWSKWVPADAENRIPLAMNCVLLERDGAHGTERVLVEAGAGRKWTDKEVAMYGLERTPAGAVRCIEDALAEVGVDPASIGHVVLTHLHFDHAGGLTRPGPGGEPESVFPNARIHVQRREWQDAHDNRSTMTKTYLRSHLDPVAGQVVLHDGPAEVLPGLHVMPLVGHTWGHQGVRWHDGQGTVLFPGDLIPTVHHVHPAASLGYDMLPHDTMLTKRAVLEQADREGWRLVLDHEPGECVMQRGTPG